MTVQETERENHKGSVYSKYSGVKAVYNVEEKKSPNSWVLDSSSCIPLDLFMTLTTANVKKFKIIVISLLDYQSLWVSPKRNWSIATSLHRTLFDGPIIIMNQSITLRNHRKIRETWPGGLILTWMNPAQGRQPNSRQPFQTNSSVTAVHY